MAKRGLFMATSEKIFTMQNKRALGGVGGLCPPAKARREKGV